MSAYIVRRLVLLPLILFGVVLLIFLMLTQLSPSVRAALYVSDIPKTPHGLEDIIIKYGLNDPVPVQFGRYIKQIAHGDLGFSKTGKQPVADLIKHRLPATAELAIYASIIIIFLGIRLGIVAALKHNKWQDQVLRAGSIIGTSSPTFVYGLLALLVFAAMLHLLPAGNRLSPQYQAVVDGPAWHPLTNMYTVDSLLNGRIDVFGDSVQHLILPVLILAVVGLATELRVTRSSMLETLRQDYVRTARAKGMPEHDVIQKHARPNAMLPVVTIASLSFIFLLNGAAITETVFNWPGVGKSFVDAATNLDIVTVLGMTLFFATLLIVGNLIVDVLYAYLDPRVRLN
jgi:peptide/nickel transport system permease protein